MASRVPFGACVMHCVGASTARPRGFDGNAPASHNPPLSHSREQRWLRRADVWCAPWVAECTILQRPRICHDFAPVFSTRRVMDKQA